MRKSMILCVVFMMVASVVCAQTLLVDEPFNSSGLAYTWDDLSSAEDYLPTIVTDSSVGITDQDGDGYLGECPQPAGSTINAYYVPGVTENITDGKAEAWVYCQFSASMGGTQYVGVVGKSEATLDPGALYMYRTIWRSQDQIVRCQSYSTAGWTTIADTAGITTEGWRKTILQVQGTQVDGWDDSDHFASGDDTTTVATDLGTLWGFYCYGASDDSLYVDDCKIYTFDSGVESWDLY